MALAITSRSAYGQQPKEQEPFLHWLELLQQKQQAPISFWQSPAELQNWLERQWLFDVHSAQKNNEQWPDAHSLLLKQVWLLPNLF